MSSYSLQNWEFYDLQDKIAALKTENERLLCDISELNDEVRDLKVSLKELRQKIKEATAQ